MSIIGMKSTTYNQSSIIVDLQGNPLQCSCKNVDILEWIVYKRIHLNIRAHYCFFKNTKVKINLQALDKTKYLCIEVYISAISTASGFIFVGAASVIATYIFLKIKKKKQK